LSLVVLYLLIAWRATPAALPANASNDLFSAGRAVEVLRTILGSEMPHPLGSREAALVRAHVVEQLGRLHIHAEVHEGYACGKWGRACGPVHNIVARLPGREDGKAVLLAVHSDSVPAGPGAGDDGSGVAALIEIARVLSTSPPLRHPVILLIDDGEEEGLLGAKAFVATDPWMKDVGAVVNMEARGTSGASRLFETSGPNRWLVEHVARALKHPATSSIDTTVYERLPNDTDLTVFKAAGIPGVNFAFIGDASRYHTPRDEVDNLSLASLQHHGDNGLAAVRALADADFDQASPGKAVFFDVLGFFIVSWPERASIPMAAVALVLLAATLWRVRPKPAPLIVLVRAGLILGATAASFGILFLLVRIGVWAGALPSPWVAWSAPLILLSWLVPVTVYLALLWLTNLFVDDATDWLTVWGLWTLIALALSIFVPGASFLFLLPAIVAGAVGVVAIPAKRTLIAAIAPLGVAALLWFPLLEVWYAAMGTQALPLLAALVALFASAALPLLAMFERPRLAPFINAFVPAIGVLVLLSASLPPHSEDSPGPLVFQYQVDGDTHVANWLVSTREAELPEGLAKLAKFQHVEPTSWLPMPGFSTSAGTSTLAPPEVLVLENLDAGTNLRRVRMHLLSPRRAPILRIAHASGDSDVLNVMGQTASPRPGPAAYTFWDVPAGGLDVELTLAATERQIVVSDISPGLPTEGAAMLAARPKELVPIQWGDTVSVSRVATF
jgi:hypothetical protein